MRKIQKKGQVSIGAAPGIVMIVGLVFLIMATIAFVANEYGDAILSDGESCGDVVACNVTLDLQTELGDNTSIAGIVLTISLIAIVLGVLIGSFAFRKSL